MPALEGRWGHTQFGSLQRPGLWVQLGEPSPLLVAGLGILGQEEAALV